MQVFNGNSDYVFIPKMKWGSLFRIWNEVCYSKMKWGWLFWKWNFKKLALLFRKWNECCFFWIYYSENEGRHFQNEMRLVYSEYKMRVVFLKMKRVSLFWICCYSKNENKGHCYSENEMRLLFQIWDRNSLFIGSVLYSE